VSLLGDGSSVPRNIILFSARVSARVVPSTVSTRGVTR